MSYFDIPRISNSALSCLDPETGGHPEKYRDFIDGKYKQESTSMSLGDIIHRHLLLHEAFAVIDRKPGDVLVKILDEYYAHLNQGRLKPFKVDSDKDTLLKIIRANAYYNNRKDETVIEGVIREGAEYFNFLLQNNGKTAISADWRNILDKLSLSVLRPPIQEIFNPENQEGIEILSEHEIQFEIRAKSYLNTSEIYECKAKIDRLILDHKSKTYRIIDLKSTSSLLELFTDSVKRYKYHRQLAFYSRAVQHIVPKDYVLEGIFILALETTDYFRARLFMLDNSTITKGEHDYLNLLKRVSYHNASFNWVYPMEEEINEGIYTLVIS